MEDIAAAERDAVYDIQMCRHPPESLRSRYPSMRVRTSRAQTALQREVRNPGQLDALLQNVRAVGLVVTDLHRLAPVPPQDVTGATDDPAAPEGATAATYEVRVVGEVGSRLLRYLRCLHYVVPEQTTVRLKVDPAGLTGFLQACTECGARIERICRVGSPSPRGRTTTG